MSAIKKGSTIARIAKDRNISSRTLLRWKKQFCTKGHLRKKTKCGRGRALTKDQVRHIRDKLKSNRKSA